MKPNKGNRIPVPVDKDDELGIGQARAVLVCILNPEKVRQSAGVSLEEHFEETAKGLFHLVKGVSIKMIKQYAEVDRLKAQINELEAKIEKLEPLITKHKS